MTHLPTLVLLTLAVVLAGMLTACTVHAHSMLVLPVVLGVGKSYDSRFALSHDMRESERHTQYSVPSFRESDQPTCHVTIPADSATRSVAQKTAVCVSARRTNPRSAFGSRRLRLRFFGAGAPLEIGESRKALGKLPEDLFVFFQF
jgi:hypothetical protein